MKRFLTIVSMLAAALVGSNAFAAGSDMSTMGAMKGPAMAGTTSGYSFELAGPPKSASGIAIVSVRIVHAADKKPVTGAIIIQSRADMGPEGMGSMTAPIKAQPTAMPGVYTFEVQYGGVWNKPGKWELSFSAKVQGEAQTVHGAVTVSLGS